MSSATTRGFTLVELLITVALLTLLVTIAIPSFNAFIQHNRERAIRDQLLSSLQHARAEAVYQQTQLMFCGSSDASQCDGAWDRGWLTLRLPDQAVLAHHQPQSGTRLLYSGFSQAITYYPNGTTPTGNGRFSLCAEDAAAWELILNRQGRVRHAESNELGSNCSTSRPTS